MAATTNGPSMALPSRRTLMRASVHSHSWCCPSLMLRTGSTECMHGERSSNGCCPPISARDEKGSNWQTFKILWERIRPLCQIGFSPLPLLLLAPQQSETGSFQVHFEIDDIFLRSLSQMNNARRILSKASTLLRGSQFWSKKLHFHKNVSRNFITLRRKSSWPDLD